MCDHTCTQHIYIRTIADNTRTISGTNKIEEKQTGNTIKTIFTMWMTTAALNNTILTQW